MRVLGFGIFQRAMMHYKHSGRVHAGRIGLLPAEEALGRSAVDGAAPAAAV